MAIASNFITRVKDAFLGPSLPAPQLPAIQSKQPTVAEQYARLRSGNPALLARQEVAERKMKVFDRDLYGLVDEKLRKGFRRENYERLHLTIHTSSNLLRRVARETSILYERPAERMLLDQRTTQTDQSDGGTSTAAVARGEDLEGEGEEGVAAVDIGTGDAEVDDLAGVLELESEEEQQEDTPFDLMLKASDWDVILDQVEQLCVAQEVVWIRPMVVGPLNAEGKLDPSTAKLKYVIYTPADATGVPDPHDPTQLLAWYYRGEELYTPDGGAPTLRQVIHYFEADTYKKFDPEWRVLEVHENRVGRVPVTAFRIDRPRRGYYCEGQGSDLYDATLELCVLRTIQNQRAKDSGFKQLALVGVDPAQLPQDQVMGSNEPIIIPGGEAGAGVSVLDLQPQLDQWTLLCKERAKEIYDDYGVSVDVEQVGQPESGYAKKLRMAKVLKESRRRRKFFAAAEQDLYHNVAVTLRAFPVSAIGQLDANAELQVDFAEPEFEENPWEQARIDSLRLKLNLDSIIDLLRRDNPDLSDAELVRHAFRNRRLNEVLMTADQVRLTELLATRDTQAGGAGGPGGLDGGGGTGQPPPRGGAPAEG